MPARGTSWLNYFSWKIRVVHIVPENRVYETVRAVKNGLCGDAVIAPLELRR